MKYPQVIKISLLPIIFQLVTWHDYFPGKIYNSGWQCQAVEGKDDCRMMGVCV